MYFKETLLGTCLIDHNDKRSRTNDIAFPTITMDFVEKQAVHIGYRTLWTQRTQLTIYGYHDKFFQFHFLHEENSHLIGRLASLPLTFLEKKI